jgi:hypothetical protein
MWSWLTGPNARRHAKGFSPIVGFKDSARPELAALIPFCVQWDEESGAIDDCRGANARRCLHDFKDQS